MILWHDVKVSFTKTYTTFDSSVCKKKTFGRAKKKVLNFLSVLFWHFVDFHSIIQGKKRKLLKYKKKSLKDVKQKMIDFANCHLPGFEFPFCLLVVLLRAFSMRNGSATCVYMLRYYCLQLLSNAVEVFSKSVDSTKRRRTRKHANSCSSSKRGNAYCGFATGIMVKFLFSHIFIQLRKWNFAVSYY